MFKKLNSEERNLLQQAGVPISTEIIVFATDIIGRKFSFTLDEEAYASLTLYGVIGSIQIFTLADNEYVIITPATPFPTDYFDLVIGFRYENNHWRIITSNSKYDRDYVRKGKMFF